MLGMLRSLAALALASLGQDAVPVRVDARVELLTLVFRLIGANEYDQQASDSPYARAAEEWFGPARDHEVFRLAEKLRTEHGIGFDAVPSLAVHLTQPPELALRLSLEPWPERLESRWKGADLEGFLKALRGFAADTDFLEFLKEHEDVQRAAEKSLAAAIDSTHVIAWLREFFGLAAGTSYQAIPGLLCGPGNYGQSVRLADGTLELWPVIGADTWDAAGFPVYDQRHVGTVVHEFTHAFANPVVDANWAALAPAFERLFPSVKEVMARQAYGTPKTVACESLVRACVVRHAARHLGPEAAAKQQAYEIGRGFTWTGELAALLAQYEAERKTYPTLKDFGPKLAEFFEGVARKNPAAEKPPAR
jgi:hypothetical protein